MIQPYNTGRLARMPREVGADADLRCRDTGHGLAYEEVRRAKEWLSRILLTRPRG